MIDYIHDIIDKYNRGEYEAVELDVPDLMPDDTVIDEDMSVKWNRSKVQEHNDMVRKAIVENRNRKRQAMDAIKTDIISFLVKNYRFTTKQATLIEGSAYEDKHSCTTDYIYEADRLAQLVFDVINIKEN